MTFYTSHISPLTLSGNQQVVLAQEPLGSGGEGHVYDIVSPASLQGYVVKLFHPKERTEKRKTKLEYMLTNRPALPENYTLIWVEDLVYEDSKFAGYLMKKAPGKYDLTVLSSLKISPHLDESWHRRYTRDHVTGFLNRCKLCHQIAIAVHQLHRNSHYVMVDIKPENIRVSLNGNVSLIDLDSIEIIENEKLLYAAEKLSNEYSPAEMQHIDLETDVIYETWGQFSMAIVFYKLLFGLHPYTGTPGEMYDKCVSYTQKIRAGLLPLGKRAADFEVIPRPHENFRILSEEIQQLFLNSLDNNPEKRPSLNAWIEVFQSPQINVLSYRNPLSCLSSANFPQQVIQRPDFDIPYPSFLQKKRDLIHWITMAVSMGSFYIISHTEQMPVAMLWFLGAGFLSAAWLVFFAKKLSGIEIDEKRQQITLRYKGVIGRKSIKKFAFDEVEISLEKDTKKIPNMFRILKKKAFFGKTELGRFKAQGIPENTEVIKRLEKILLKTGLLKAIF